MRKDLLEYVNFPRKKAVLLQSGGLDSCVCDGFLTWANFDVIELFIDYGQSARDKELEMARKMSEYYGHKLVTMQIHLPWFNHIPIVGGEITHDCAEDIKLNRVNAESYVPLRNHLLLSIAGTLAEKLQYKYICTGVCGAQTFLGKPLYGCVDTHKNFVKAIENSLNEGSTFKHKSGNSFKVLAPLLGMTKTEIIELGLNVGADMSLSWSCYNSGGEPCLKCSSCVDRELGFKSLGVPDPLLKISK